MQKNLACSGSVFCDNPNPDYTNKSVHEKSAKDIVEEVKKLSASVKKIYSDENKIKFFDLYTDMKSNDSLKNLILNINVFKPSVQNAK